jgi:non-heme chloroperoxidase
MSLAPSCRHLEGRIGFEKKMPKITVGAESGAPVELYYEVQGGGAPVVLIHGWPLSGRSWDRQVLALVEAGYQAVTYDRRGFGYSAPTWDGHDYDTIASDLHALLTHLDLSGVTLVGYSAGGGAVARYISNHGTARVAKAVLASSVTPFLHVTEGNPEGGLDDGTIAHFEAGIRADRPGFVDQFLTLLYSAGGKSTVSEAQRLFGRDQANLASARATLTGPSQFGRTDFRPDLEKFDVPTLVIHGDSDAVVPFHVSGRRSAAAITGSELVLIEGGPHGIIVSHADEFNAALLDFLAR